jgi:hypothetical protein
MGYGSKTTKEEITLSTFLTIEGDLLGASPEEWNVAVRIADRIHAIDAGDLDPKWFAEGPDPGED